MGKTKAKRRLPDDAAIAKASSLRTSARKLNLVAASIRGKSAAAALTQLTFEKRRIAQEVKKVLQSAVANAENNHSLDVDKLYVAEAWVGRSFVMKRFDPRGRGRSSGIDKPFSNLTIIVRERQNKEEDTKKVTTSTAAAPKAKTAPKAKAGAKKTTKKGAAQAAAGA